MYQQSTPAKQGLYDPALEHDACGIGFVANIKGMKSNSIIRDALQLLVNMDHRGGSGVDVNSGDGAGILIQLPHYFLANEAKRIGISLKNKEDFAVGMLFLPSKEAERNDVYQILQTLSIEEGLPILGFRDVPTNPSLLGKEAFDRMPHICQMFIEKPKNTVTSLDFERKLYVFRKRMENLAIQKSVYFYCASLSSQTIVYKGMLTPDQLGTFYLDLTRLEIASAIALVHSRFSTNTFPSWDRAHPNRYLIHNGEINTIRGNVNWMKAREKSLTSDIFKDKLPEIMPIIRNAGSDSAMFDNCLEFLTLSGRDLPHAMMMMIPEPWEKHTAMPDYQKAFYEYHSCLMEPWDGPAAMAFTDGKLLGAILDRNGLRPARYYVTSDDRIILASEVGALPIPEETVIRKERLHPGKMLLIDTVQGKIMKDKDIKQHYAKEHPYQDWLSKHLVSLESLPQPKSYESYSHNELLTRQKIFGYTYDDLRILLTPMAQEGVEPLGSMGIDTPLAILSEQPQLLYNYFKQLFAQVTNPPIDAIREEIITSSELYIGSAGNVMSNTPENCRQIKLQAPLLDNIALAKLKELQLDGFSSAVFPIVFDHRLENGLEISLHNLFLQVKNSIATGTNIIILSDREVSENFAPIPALLAVSGLHHYLISEGIRSDVAIVLESGEPREIHHFATLIGYGVSAINPYLALETVSQMLSSQMILDISLDKAISNYLKASTKGIVKVLSKMGISTMQSYQGAQIFEALGLHTSVIDTYFTDTPSRIGGIDIRGIEREVLLRHTNAFNSPPHNRDTLDTAGTHQWRAEGEYHLFNPSTIHLLQKAVRRGEYNIFREFSKALQEENEQKATLRGMLQFTNKQTPVPIDEVESVESICKRFKTGAMSYGSISQEAHETMAIAMNRIGGKSNSGEGGEDADRFIPDANGDSRSSAIKQVASGRFGVTSHYLVNAKEIQIKLAQGAKPGEGGQLPGKKVYPWIAKVRHSTAGVGLISPPPHHDIYSIEDLAELIFDLKNANRHARISVKLVSEVGVGTIAAGVAKGKADVILISGYDGGTGASPRTSIQHAGLPWELGLAETHQTLLLNKLRNRVTLEVDGKLLTGRDVVIAALLGAEEFGFATAPLISIGCVMMRVCHQDTCPVGIATQNPKLRKHFQGSPEHVIHFMQFIAQEVREIMASLGARTITELIGRTDLLEMVSSHQHWKAEHLELSNLLHIPENSLHTEKHCTEQQNHGLEKTLDLQTLLPLCQEALEHGSSIEASLPIRNTNRVVGTILGSEISKKYGQKGLPEDTITLRFIGSAGQSFGAFLPNGVTMYLEGDANDYIGKGLSGGKIAVYPSRQFLGKADENIIIGNVAFYGATSGEAYIAGIAGERFCVRNSGLDAVVEGVGDHGCEYMTGGNVVVLGKVGRNFAAGMSGGIVYVFDEDDSFSENCNMEMIGLYSLENQADIQFVKKQIEKHARYTGSQKAHHILQHWNTFIHKIIKVLPHDFKKMQEAIDFAYSVGLSGTDALMHAFEGNYREVPSSNHHSNLRIGNKRSDTSWETQPALLNTVEKTHQKELR